MTYKIKISIETVPDKKLLIEVGTLKTKKPF